MFSTVYGILGFLRSRFGPLRELLLLAPSVVYILWLVINFQFRSHLESDEASASGALKTIAAAQTDYNN